MAPKYPSDEADKFMLRLVPGLRDRLAESARLNSRSMNAEVNARLQASFEASPMALPLVLAALEQRLAEMMEALTREQFEHAMLAIWARHQIDGTGATWSKEELATLRATLDPVIRRGQEAARQMVDVLTEAQVRRFHAERLRGQVASEDEHGVLELTDDRPMSEQVMKHFGRQGGVSPADQVAAPVAPLTRAQKSAAPVKKKRAK